MSARLLLVDGDRSVHEILTGILKRGDRNIDNAYDGCEALERLRGAPFDLVVAGEGTNGPDPLKLLRRVRALRPETRVILTGAADPARAIRAIRERAYSYFHKPLPEGPLADMVQQALDSSDPSSWQDDIRVVSAHPRWVAIEVRAKYGAAERTTHLVREVAANLPRRKCEDVTAAFRELLLNAVEHGCGMDPSKRVRVSLVRTQRALIVRVEDPGKGFSMDLLPHAAVSNPDGAPTQHVEIREERGQRPGGFGILMTRNLVDELAYNERGNEALFVKYI
jgi:anti-sigma regulatory factor (Ser/Thr protein kinase)/CheY-like chemotaxis protein